MHTWLIFSGCIPTRSMSTLYIRDISVNKSKQSVWTRRGNISAHYNAGAGARVRRWSGVSLVPLLLYRAVWSCAPVRVSTSSDCSAAVGSSVLNSDQRFYNYTIRSIHCLVEPKLEEINFMDASSLFFILFAGMDLEIVETGL